MSKSINDGIYGGPTCLKAKLESERGKLAFLSDTIDHLLEELRSILSSEWRKIR